MKNETKNIRFKDLSFNLQFLILLMGIVLLGLFVYCAMESKNIESIPNLPHKYCHNETNTKTYNFNLNMNINTPTDNCFPINQIILCDEGYIIEKYSTIKCVYPSWSPLNEEFPSFGKKEIIGTFNDGIYSQKCLIQEVKDVCEVK
jgi:hypothetical protein